MRLFSLLLLGLFSYSATAALPELNQICSQTKVSIDDFNQGAWSKQYSKDEQTLWFRVKAPRGVALVVHGLNYKPSKMNDVVDLFTRESIDVLRLSLSGHRGSVDEAREIRDGQWQKEIYAAYCLVKARAMEQGVPIYFSGFSLGALLMNELLNSRTPEKISLEGMVMFAPALTPSFAASLSKLFYVFGNSFLVPSVGPVAFQASPGTTVAEYKSVFASKSRIESTGLERSNIPSLVLVDPKDEVLDVDGLEDVIKRHHLSKWQVQRVTNEKLHHLVVVKEDLGEAQWAVIRSRVHEMLNRK